MNGERPKRRAVPLPATGEPPRVGKVRLGVTKTRARDDGREVSYPSATDYFVVTADDGGVTSPESAASFHDVYPGEPRVLSCVIPAATAEQVMEGAWRLYGFRKLKRKCDGEECDVRTETGGWETKPCVCKAQGIPEEIPHSSGNMVKNPDHCRLIFTLNILLPGVQGVGVWQVETQSAISARRISNWLRMMEDLVGDLRLVPFELHLVPADVAPGGRSKTVYVLEPRATAETQEIIALRRRNILEPGVAKPEIEPGTWTPPPAADEDDADYSYEDPDEQTPAGREPDGVSTGTEAQPPSGPEEGPGGDSPPPAEPHPGVSRLDELKGLPEKLAREDPDQYGSVPLAVIRQQVISAGIEWKTKNLADDETWAKVVRIVQDVCRKPGAEQQRMGV